MLSIPFGNGSCSFSASTVSPFSQRANSPVVVRITGIALGWMGATMALASVVKNPNSSSLLWPANWPCFAAIQAKRESGRQAGGGGQHLGSLVCASISGRSVALRRRGEGSSRRDCAFDVPHDRHEGVRGGRQDLPLLSQNLGVERTQVWRYLNGRTPVQARSPPQSRAGSRARTKQTKKPAGVVPAGSDCSALSAGPECLEPIARGEILNPIPSRPVHIMATAIVRVHRDSRSSRFRVARDGGGNNSRFMMSSVSMILTISLGDRRRTEESDSRHRC
jgi:hypothetical protein